MSVVLGAGAATPAGAGDGYRPGEPVWVWIGRYRAWLPGEVAAAGPLAVLARYEVPGGGSGVDTVAAAYVRRRGLYEEADMPTIQLAMDDWRPPAGVAAGPLEMQVIGLAPADDPGWVWARGWWFPDEVAPEPELVRFQARWAALPEQLRQLLPEDRDDGH